MKRTITLLFIIIINIGISFCQSIITISPDSIQGKDALLHELYPTTNYATTPEFLACAWTFQGAPGKVKSLIQFDYSQIPTGSKIDSAILSLYAWDLQSSSGQHSTLDGSNACWLERVTSTWIESTVTWATQPTTTTQNRVSLPASSSPTQNYLDINVTTLVKDMMSNANYGFMLKLQTESYYRRMNFCSSNHTNAALRPLLTVYLANSTSSTYATPNYISIKSVFVKPGKQGLMTVSLQDKEPVKSVEFQLQLQTGISIDGAKLVKSARLTNQSVTVTNLGANRYNIFITSASQSLITGNSGELFSIPLAVDASTPVADVLCSTTNCLLMNAGNQNVNTQNAAFYVIMTKGNCCN